LKLLEMYQKIWSEGEFAKEWRRATVVPILKPGKNPTNTESYRPISLTSCLCKILERIINKRLIYVLESRNIKYVFRKGRSTTDILVILHVAEAFRKNNQLSKPYNMSSRYAIIKKIKKWKIYGCVSSKIS
jgi:hypothetical protein